MQGRPSPSALVASSVILALLADVLLCGASWGVNIGLWTVAIASTCALLRGFGSLPSARSSKRLAAGVLAFALLFAFRDSDILKVANGLAIVFLLGAILLPAPPSLRDASLTKLLYAPALGLATLSRESFTLISETRKEREASPEFGRRGKAVLRGLCFAVPLLLVFGGLFASADAVFESKVEDLFRFDFDFGAANSRFWTLLFSLVFVGGLLRRSIFGAAPAVPPIVREGTPSGLGITEIGIVIGSLAFLFGSFLVVQFRYLFGARSLVTVTPGLSYAEYARGGFFQLVCVAALAFVVLLGTHALLKRERPSDEAVYRWLGRTLVGMVFLVVLSALTRMKLYADAFGLTELRIYSTVFMVWLTLAFVWLLATTLAGRPQRLASGMLVAGLLTIFATNVLNPDGLIVRTNLSKPNADYGYLMTLSDDAVLASIGVAIPATHRTEWSAFLERRRAEAARSDWRELNLTRWSLARR